MRDAGERCELGLERVHMRAERRYPVRVDCIPDVVELAAGEVGGREVDPRHRGEPTEACGDTW
jgi:hypothetical protein